MRILLPNMHINAPYDATRTSQKSDRLYMTTVIIIINMHNEMNTPVLVVVGEFVVDKPASIYGHEY